MNFFQNIIWTKGNHLTILTSLKNTNFSLKKRKMSESEGMLQHIFSLVAGRIKDVEGIRYVTEAGRNPPQEENEEEDSESDDWEDEDSSEDDSDDGQENTNLVSEVTGSL